MSERLAIEGGPKVRTKPFPPWPHFFEDEMQEVQKVLEEGKVNYWTGPRGREFQEGFARYCGAKHGVAVANGTAALHVALAASHIGPAPARRRWLVARIGLTLCVQILIAAPDSVRPSSPQRPSEWVAMRRTTTVTVERY